MECLLKALHLVVHREPYVLTRLAAGSPIAGTAPGRYSSVSQLGGETTVVSERRYAPEGQTQAGFRLIEIVGEFALDSVGDVAAVAGPLAAAGIGLFAFSVWSSDVFLVQEADLDRAVCALTEAAHVVAMA
jgi:hypothetical protein